VVRRVHSGAAPFAPVPSRGEYKNIGVPISKEKKMREDCGKWGYLLTGKKKLKKGVTGRAGVSNYVLSNIHLEREGGRTHGGRGRGRKGI